MLIFQRNQIIQYNIPLLFYVIGISFALYTVKREMCVNLRYGISKLVRLSSCFIINYSICH